MIKKFLLMGIIPLAIITFFSLLEAFSLLTPLEHRFYDLALNARPDVPEDSRLLLVDVDDEAIEKSKKPWPWPRDLMANGLVLMKEFGASYQVSDILYEQPSEAGINLDKYQGIHDTYEHVFSTLRSDFVAFAEAIFQGSLPVGELGPFVEMYIEELENSKGSLLDNIEAIAENKDELLGKASRSFGNSYFTVNIPTDSADRAKGIDPALIEKAFVKNADIKGAIAARAPDIILPIEPVLKGAKALGFPVVKLDQPDGVTRRINLFYEYQSRVIPQLGLAPLLDLLGNPAVEIGTDRVILKGALHPGLGKQLDISIPLAEDGTMLINWPKKNFHTSFRHISYWLLLQHDRVEESLIFNLSLLADLERNQKLLVTGGPSFFLENSYRPLVRIKNALLEGDTTVDFAGYVRRRNELAQKIEDLCSPARESEYLGRAAGVSPQETQEIKALITAACQANRERLLPLYRDTRKTLQENLSGAFCFTSWTATSTTDIGVTPFVGEYANVGTHAAIVNTILSGQFLDDSPPLAAIIMTVILSLFMYLVVFGIKKPILSVAAGAGGLILIAGSLILFFVLTGIYPGMISPFFAPFFIYIIFTVINFLKTAKEKNFIRNAFSQYLSKEIINELIADPSKLNLVGETKTLTALFTDIKGFSGLSEVLEAPHLVRLLNDYLTDMSNIIMELSGTIDKYVGDAIVSFFGAPVNLPRHAHNACLAAVRMRKAEKILNERLMAEKLSPSELHTRIGLNTGEMVVGNMGSALKLNYTIMGHSVNLASRLEGVNKQYGTWILMSENTYDEGGEAFLARQLDRVRVVGINKAVRLYELIDEKSEVRPEMFEVVELFHQGLELFEQHDWDRARSLFKEVLKLNPDDAPANVYIKRCLQYKKEPPASGWDGIFSLTTK